MPILPLAHFGHNPNHAIEPIMAQTIKDTRAATTSIARSERLLLEGYTFRRLSAFGRVTVEVQGTPTQHRRRSGETYIDPHGPYSVDPLVGTCTCPAFANREVCPHVDAARDWLVAWERGESAPVVSASLDGLIALREIGGGRFHCQERRVVVFRNWERAGEYWEAEGLVGICELVELSGADLLALRQSGRYRGLLLHTRRHTRAIEFGTDLPVGARR